MHCDEPGCLAACPAPGAIVQYANGIVDVNPDQCIGCGYCETGCPFDVPRFHQTTGKMAKCTLCVDRVVRRTRARVHQGLPDRLPPVRHEGRHGRDGAAPRGSAEGHRFQGSRCSTTLRASGGTGVVTVLAHGDHPEWYNLPADPHVPLLVKFWKSVLRPLGVVAIFGAVIGAFGHYMNHGRKGVKGADAQDANLPDALAAKKGRNHERSHASPPH